MPGALGAVSEELFALNPITGQQLWRFTPSIGPATTFRRIATDGTHFIVASSHLFSVDAFNGKERWVRAVADDTLSPVINDIVTRDGVLFAGYLVYHPQPYNRGVGGVMAVSTTTGDVLWHRLFQDSTTDYWIDELEINSTHLYALDSKGRIQVLDKSNGNVVRVIEREESNESTSRPQFRMTQLLVSDDTLIVSASSRQAAISAINARTFDKLWSVNIPGFSVSQVVIDDSNVYAVAALGNSLY